MEERHEHLIQAALDGVLTPGERAELERLLGADDEAKRYYQQMLTTVRAVEQLPIPEPPQNLKVSIIEAVENDRRHRRTPEHRKPYMALAASVTLGVGVAFVASQFQVDDSSAISATMAPGIEAAAPLNRLTIEGDGFTADINLFEDDGKLVLDVKTPSADISVQPARTEDWQSSATAEGLQRWTRPAAGAPDEIILQVESNGDIVKTASLPTSR